MPFRPRAVQIQVPATAPQMSPSHSERCWIRESGELAEQHRYDLLAGLDQGAGDIGEGGDPAFPLEHPVLHPHGQGHDHDGGQIPGEEVQRRCGGEQGGDDQQHRAGAPRARHPPDQRAQGRAQHEGADQGGGLAGLRPLAARRPGRELGGAAAHEGDEEVAQRPQAHRVDVAGQPGQACGQRALLSLAALHGRATAAALGVFRGAPRLEAARGPVSGLFPRSSVPLSRTHSRRSVTAKPFGGSNPCRTATGFRGRPRRARVQRSVGRPYPRANQVSATASGQGTAALTRRVPRSPERAGRSLR